MVSERKGAVAALGPFGAGAKRRARAIGLTPIAMGKEPIPVRNPGEEPPVTFRGSPLIPFF